MDIRKLLHDHRIPIAPPGDSNYHEGWVNIRCPHCNDHSTHLGVNIQNGYANCWRCGHHFLDKTVAKVLNIPVGKAKKLLKEYGGQPVRKAKEIKRAPRTKSHTLPSSTDEMSRRHRKYLQSRGFDADKIAREWGVLGTGPVSTLDGISYKHRILAPIWWGDQQVSWQTRDITGKAKAKYMACPKDRELVEHQTVLYGKQSAWTETGICVEGITDVWRLGPKAFATFGIDYTPQQLRHIARNFMRIILIFDQEPQAQSQARKLRAELEIRGREVVQLDLKKDPAELTEKQAKSLVKKIF